ncbi:undecaprenyl-diphosphate phosphatase [Sabulicella glaciei]|uniref:Undecaprenyl-diphosphatase n=1 Tax=Sabulicella glaciei TaxID=2984948 RepID=A0ABT3NWZ5_9PROT|nr:undecaprenyl-diphosphate phosphatase [Roseococcus sp. MDT2-1-1]MCW8086692.1 undecaprenyl-diphosphate phosphatase [Roseococcus sp. MDT2-1-1]
MLDAILMGILEGLTEFLPVSSTGHLILLGELIGFEGPPGKVFEISIQLGAILAVIWLFRARLLALARRAWLPGTDERALAVNLLLAFLPAMVIGATLHGTITRMLFNPWVVCFALIAGGIAIIVIERKVRVPTIRTLEEMGPGAALLIGFGQVLAMIPGTSRSGATIITALLCGVERKAAAEFSFLLAIPTMLAAAAFSLFKVRDELSADGLGLIAVGFVAAFLVALVTVRLVMAFIARIGFTPFGWYRIAVGLVMLLVLSLGS